MPMSNDDAIIRDWKPVFEAAGIDPRRVPLDDFDVLPDRIEYRYIVNLEVPMHRERRVLPLPIAGTQ